MGDPPEMESDDSFLYGPTPQNAASTQHHLSHPNLAPQVYNASAFHHNGSLPGLNTFAPSGHPSNRDQNQDHIASLLRQLGEAGYSFPFPPGMQSIQPPAQQHPPPAATAPQRSYGAAAQQDSTTTGTTDVAMTDREEGELSDTEGAPTPQARSKHQAPGAEPSFRNRGSPRNGNGYGPPYGRNNSTSSRGDSDYYSPVSHSPLGPASRVTQPRVARESRVANLASSSARAAFSQSDSRPASRAHQRATTDVRPASQALKVAAATNTAENSLQSAAFTQNPEANRLIEQIIEDLGSSTAEEKSRQSLAHQREGTKKFISLLHFYGYVFTDLIKETFFDKHVDWNTLAEHYKELKLPVPEYEQLDQTLPAATKAGQGQSSDGKDPNQLARGKNGAGAALTGPVAFSRSTSNSILPGQSTQAIGSATAKPVVAKQQPSLPKQTGPPDRAAYLARLRQAKLNVGTKAAGSAGTPTPKSATPPALANSAMLVQPTTAHQGPQPNGTVPPTEHISPSESLPKQAAVLREAADLMAQPETGDSGASSAPGPVSPTAANATKINSIVASTEGETERKKKLNSLLHERLAQMKAKQAAPTAIKSASPPLSNQSVLGSQQAPSTPTTPDQFPAASNTQLPAVANATQLPPSSMPSVPAPPMGSIPGLFMSASPVRMQSNVSTPSSMPAVAQAPGILPDPVSAQQSSSKKRPVASDFDNFSVSSPPRPFKRSTFGSNPYGPEEQMIIQVSDDESDDGGVGVDEEELDDMISAAAGSTQPMTQPQQQTPYRKELRNLGPLKDLPSHASAAMQLSAGSSAFNSPGPGTPGGNAKLSAMEALIAEEKAKIRAKEAMKRIRNNGSRPQTPAKLPNLNAPGASPIPSAPIGSLPIRSPSALSKAAESDAEGSQVQPLSISEPAQPPGGPQTMPQTADVFSVGQSSQKLAADEAEEMKQMAAEQAPHDLEKSVPVAEEPVQGGAAASAADDLYTVTTSVDEHSIVSAAPPTLEAESGAQPDVPVVQSKLENQQFALAEKTADPSLPPGVTAAKSPNNKSPVTGHETGAALDQTSLNTDAHRSLWSGLSADAREAVGQPTNGSFNVSCDRDEGEGEGEDDDEDLYSPQPRETIKNLADNVPVAEAAEDDYNMSDVGEAYSPYSPGAAEIPGVITRPPTEPVEPASISRASPQIYERHGTTEDARVTGAPRDAGSSPTDGEEGEINEDDDEDYEPELPDISNSALTESNVTLTATENALRRGEVMDVDPDGFNDAADAESDDVGSPDSGSIAFADDLAPELQSSDAGQLQTVPAPPAEEATFQAYQSPLRMFKAYRYHPSYTQDVQGGFKSMTYNHRIDPNMPLCAFEAGGGVCNDGNCQGQHFRGMALSDDQLLVQIGSAPANFSDEQKNRWNTELREVLRQLRTTGTKDPTVVIDAITRFRRTFLVDPTKVLNL